MKIYCDGAVSGNPGPGAIAFVGYGNKGIVVQHAEMLPHTVTNNVAEYAAIVYAMDYLYHHPGSYVIYSDSELVIKQIQGHHKVKNGELKRLNKLIQDKVAYGIVGGVIFEWIPREENEKADRLAKLILKEYLSGNKERL